MMEAMTLHYRLHQKQRKKKKQILKNLKNAEEPISATNQLSPSIQYIHIYSYYQNSTWTYVHLTSDTLRLDT